MISYHVIIPNDKQAVFQEFLEIIGAEYSEQIDDLTLTLEQQGILEQRLAEPTESYVPLNDALKQLYKKYDL
ncbi:hypothetical protein HX052_17085 [Myroides marinus]|uniref:hypothetical protein n=1 Tax=Myroides TaxID=76831 RepID=UPI000741E0CF|nr:hypothetical protein [Myroides marinus]KUF43397.1 hypothetical protein AS361_10785 [Myroides marinus]MDM1372790.1 hypothetical protein [Myroides marinus]MDM1376293.1 hypothetical protein [Myroides marinus]MDM1382113.1 hypothetical protein [Myroides marinus]MDM1391653.1 hypothetical protein [Myroides marinus]